MLQRPVEEYGELLAHLRTPCIVLVDKRCNSVEQSFSMHLGQKARFINELCGWPRSFAVPFLPLDFSHKRLYFKSKLDEFIDGHSCSRGNLSHVFSSSRQRVEAHFLCWGKFSFTPVFQKEDNRYVMETGYALEQEVIRSLQDQKPFSQLPGVEAVNVTGSEGLPFDVRFELRSGGRISDRVRRGKGRLHS